MTALASLFAWLPAPAPDFGWPDEPLSAQLATARHELSAALRKIASLDGQLQHWIDQAIRARAERNQAYGDNNQLRQYLVEKDVVLTQALADKADLTARVLVLEEELRDTTRGADNLRDIVHHLQDELRELRAGLAVGALRKGRR